MDRYEVMAGKMAPLTDGAHRKWGFTGKVETRSYERLVDALIDFVETGDGLKARFLTGFTACLAADRGGRIHCHPYPLLGWWKEAARSGRSSLRRTSIWHGWNTRQTVIRRSTVTWIR